jgi:uncharacterized protein (TIGR00106 family)
LAVIVELNIVPLGVDVSVSEYLVPVLKILDDLDVRYETNPMCTVFEAKDIEEAFNIVRAAHEAVFRKQVKRVITTVKIDDRRDVDRSMKEKLESLHKTLKSKP